MALNELGSRDPSIPFWMTRIGGVRFGNESCFHSEIRLDEVVGRLLPVPGFCVQEHELLGLGGLEERRQVQRDADTEEDSAAVVRYGRIVRKELGRGDTRCVVNKEEEPVECTRVVAEEGCGVITVVGRDGGVIGYDFGSRDAKSPADLLD